MLPTKALQDFIDRSIGNFRTSFPGLPLGVKRFLGQEARAVALVMWGSQKSVEDLDLDIVPNPKSSGDALDTWAFILGLPNGQGGYGKFLATTASGGSATLTGVKGTTYTAGLIAVAEDGTTQIELAADVSIVGSPPDFGSVGPTGVSFIAVTPGSVGNLKAGTVCTWQNPPAGADTSFTLTADLTDGNDIESNPAVYARIVQRMQTPPRGGNAQDFRTWAETVSGVVGVFVYPKRQGGGSVDVVITGGGTGTARATSGGGLVAAVEAAIAAQVSVDVDEVNVMAPSTGTALNVRVRVIPFSTKYDFDWGDEVDWTATPFTVDLYTPGTAPTLRLNTIAPDSLKAAIDAFNNTNGLAPRLQVLSTGASAVNPPIRAVNYADAGGKTTLTLEAAPAGWTPGPSVSDVVYPYGPVVETIATGLQALIDALGPSRASGHGDPITPWRDTFEINQMIRVAEDALDTDGTPLIEKVPIGGATINGSNSADVEGTDNTVNAPELLFASHIAVTP